MFWKECSACSFASTPVRRGKETVHDVRQTHRHISPPLQEHTDGRLALGCLLVGPKRFFPPCKGATMGPDLVSMLRAIEPLNDCMLQVPRGTPRLLSADTPAEDLPLPDLARCLECFLLESRTFSARI